MSFLLAMYRGESKTWTITATENGSAIDLTGATIKFAVRTSIPAGNIANDTDAMLAKTTGSGITITTAASGIFELTIDGADTAAWTVADSGTEYLAGLEYTISGVTRVLDQGKLFVSPDIVRA